MKSTSAAKNSARNWAQIDKTRRAQAQQRNTQRSYSEWRQVGAALWHFVLWFSAVACAVATATIALMETAQSSSENSPGRRQFGERFGFSGETLLHSARLEKVRSALPPLWRLIVGTARLLLLTAFLLPTTALWTSALTNSGDARATAFLLSLFVATLALLVSRWRARNLGTFALLLCSGVAVSTTIVALLRDSILQFSERGLNSSTLLWLPRSLLGWGAQNNGGTMRDTLPLSAPDAAYLVGASLVCGVAIAMGARLSRRELFSSPPLEVRHVNPLNAPLPAASRAQLKLLWFWLAVAILLAARPLGNAPGAAFLLAIAAAVTIWGWHRKALGFRELRFALLGALLAQIALLVLWSVGNGGFKSVQPWLLNPFATLSRWSQMLLSIAVAHRAVLAATTALLVSIMLLLRRQPSHLWSILDHAPAWGWMILGGLGVLPLALFVMPVGNYSVAALAIALLPAFLFVWLEGS